jgi:hypothetical protein
LIWIRLLYLSMIIIIIDLSNKEHKTDKDWAHKKSER